MINLRQYKLCEILMVRKAPQNGAFPALTPSEFLADKSDFRVFCCTDYGGAGELTSD